MKTNRLYILLSVLLVAMLITLVPSQSARADTGPKPTMHFEFVYEVDPPLTIVSGVQLECQAADCSDAKPLTEGGPQRFGCTAEECSSLAYGYADFHRLSIEFSDGKTRQSNIFSEKYFEAYFRVTVREDDLLVEELPGKNTSFLSFFALMPILGFAIIFCIIALIELPLVIILLILVIRNMDFPALRGWYIAGWVLSVPGFLLALIVEGGLLVTLVVELLLALVYALWRKRPRTKLLTVVLLMNLLTQPVLWMVVSNISDGAVFLPLAIGEAIVWLVEAGILALALRKQAKFLEALALSLVLNLASFGIGLLFPF